MFALFRSLTRNQRLLRDFIRRDLHSRYVGSSMGFFWSVVYPILNLFVYMFVFNLVLGVRFGDQASPRQVALWMLAGITVWAAYAESISRITNTLVDNANLIKKVVFPSEILPVYVTVSCLINMCIGMPIVLIGVIYFGYVAPDVPDETDATQASVEIVASAEPMALSLDGLSLQGEPSEAGEPATPAEQSVEQQAEEPAKPPKRMGLGISLLALPLLILAQAMFTTGLGYFLATLNLYLRDIYHLMGVFITVWMFSTPIFYPPEMVIDADYGWMLQINPMHWLIDSYREILIFGAWPHWLLFGRFALVGVVLLFLGSRFFIKQRARFPDLL